MKNHREISIIGIAFIFIIVISFFMFINTALPDEEPDIFVVPDSTISTDAVGDKLSAEFFINSKWLFKILVSITGLKEIEPGGYSIKEHTNLFKLIEAFSEPPELVWVLIPEGLRKEETAELIGEKLSWSKDNKISFINAHIDDEYTEGVYFPDTYLVPRNETGSEMAERMINKFNEELEPYTEEFLKENIKWTTGLKIASLIQREAANNEEMSLISGILWNRLLKDMRLQIDATLQYARGLADGTEELASNIEIGKSDWWAPISINNKEVDSPYNTYKYEGLPPTPISNPGLSAIKAAFHPEETNYLYYIHSNNQIYCSDNYDQHRQNIRQYLR